MVRDQLILDLNEELIIDNFAGGGGASVGIELALGRHVDIAINHDPEAVALHAINHPQTEHFCEDVWSVDPRRLTRGRPVGLAWFSPDCKDHSKAKGGRPLSKKIRGLAWVALKWAGMVGPRVIILENVEEFQDWGPLIAKRDPVTGRVLKKDGTVARPGERIPVGNQFLIRDNRHRGRIFRRFIRALRELGYVVEYRELRACDYDTPTLRKRLFVIARRDGRPIVLPEPTHGAPDDPLVVSGRLLPWRTAAECIDWRLSCPSIFDRNLAEATLRRIARGLRKFVIETPFPFIIRTDMAASNAGCAYPIGDPLRTVTSTGGFGVVVTQVTRARSAGRQRTSHPRPALATAHVMVNTTGHPGSPAGEPLRTIATGGHHALISTFLAKYYTGVTGSAVQKPIHTVTAIDHHALVGINLVRPFGRSSGESAPLTTQRFDVGNGGKTALASSHLTKLYGTTTGQSPREPLHTIASGGNHLGEVRAFLIKYYGEGGQHQDCRDPMHTLPTRDRLGLVTVAGQDYVIADIGMRMLEPRELYAAQGFPHWYIIAPIYRGKRLSKQAQVRMCGNSVCPPLAKALVAANLPELSVWSDEETALPAAA